MKDKVIFIAGVHGVGKTTLCNKISKKLGINAYSSSELIRKVKSISNNKKTVRDISKNQDILLESMKANIKEEKEYILDGHFILLNKDIVLKRFP